jgi:DNA adenine methylase
MSGVERGARFIYLQGSCHNGIWRVNKKGQHNAPLGRNGSGPICNEPRLRACSAALQGTNIQRADFASVLSQPVAGDLVYLDPPYVPISATSMFTSYTRDGFGTKDQVRLRDIALRLKVRGVHVILSNSSAPAVRELYARGFKIHEVQAARSINCRRDKRGPVTEFVIT